ncbi:MAG: hypothetical protein ACTSUU_06855 [Candidatus Thorarchaeota archaeon]
MKTTQMTLHLAKDLLNDGAIVVIEDEGEILRIHSYTKSMNPHELTCKLEWEGKYLKKEYSTAKLVTVITGD